MNDDVAALPLIPRPVSGRVRAPREPRGGHADLPRGPGPDPPGVPRGPGDQLAALGLVLNAVVLWNTCYPDAAVARLRTEGHEARTRTSHASPRSRTGTSTSWAAICSGRAVAVARRPCPADHTTSAGGGLRLPRRPVPPFGPPRCRHAHGVVTPNPWATNSVTCAGSSCMSLKRPHGTPATWTPPVNSSMAERDLGLAEHRPVAPTGTRLPLSPAAVRSGSQFFCRARVTPAMTAVVNIQPKAISRYASHWRPSFGQYQAVRWPRPPMGIRRSSV